MASSDPGPWHPGERAVQRRVGEEAIADGAASGVRADVPPVAAEFLARQPLLVVAATDGEGRVWASLLTGSPGFVRAPRPDVVVVDALPPPVDPLASALARPALVGALGIEPATRRRVRLNGRARPVPGGLHVELDQVFSNCPKYIQKRDLLGAAPAAASGGPGGPAPLHQAGGLLPHQRRWVEGADTFFVGTTDPDGNADASHRGGHPGFVQVLGADRFRFPDYRGNSMYTTLGNLDRQPRAGFLFVDWDGGRTLHVTGEATVDYDPAHAAGVPGAQRLVEVRVDRTVELAGSAPLAWGPPSPSRFNPPPA